MKLAKPSSKNQAARLWPALHADEKRLTFKLQIEGQTKNMGSVAINKTISEKRAKAAQAYLEKQGNEPRRITSRGFGKEKPVATNSTPDGRAKNRRVEFLILE